MIKKCDDIVVVGGGLAGLAITAYVAARGYSVRLLEAADLCSGSSGACAGRAQLIDSETPEYLDLVVRGFKRLESLEDLLECDLQWTLPGHITLIRHPEDWQEFEARTAWLSNMGLAAEMMDIAALLSAEPCLRPSGYLGGAYSCEGHLDPFLLCMGFARLALMKGAKIERHTVVTAFEKRGEQISAVYAGDVKIPAGIVILATGAWSKSLAQKAGGALPVEFTEAEALITEALPPLLNHHIGVSGFYRTVHGTEARSVTLGAGQHSNGTLLVSNAIHRTNKITQKSTCWGMPAISQALLQLIPSIKDVHVHRTWCAPSPFLPDHLPAIGWLPGVENVYVAAGFHLAIPTIPLLAEAISAEICDNILSHDLALFTPQRFTSDSYTDRAGVWKNRTEKAAMEDSCDFANFHENGGTEMKS